MLNNTTGSGATESSWSPIISLRGWGIGKGVWIQWRRRERKIEEQIMSRCLQCFPQVFSSSILIVIHGMAQVIAWKGRSNQYYRPAIASVIGFFCLVLPDSAENGGNGNQIASPQLTPLGAPLVSKGVLDETWQVAVAPGSWGTGQGLSTKHCAAPT